MQQKVQITEIAQCHRTATESLDTFKHRKRQASTIYSKVNL